MKKLLLSAALIAVSFTMTAQVGVGTTTPSAALDVVSTGTDETTTALEINNSTGRLVTVLDNGKVGIGTEALRTGGKLTVFTTSGVTGKFSSSNLSHVLQLDNTNKVNDSRSILNYHFLDAGDNDVQSGIQGRMVDATDGAAKVDLIFYTADNGTNFSEKMRILSNGRLGIGTNAPGAKLHIGGISGTDGLMFPDGTLQTTAFTGSKFVDGTTPADAVFTGGKVGIGTNAPSALLDLGSATTGTNFFSFRDLDWNIEIGTDLYNTGVTTTGGVQQYNLVLNQGAKQQALVLADAPNDDSTIFAVSSSNVSGDWSSKLVVQDGGNVGIGSSTPSAKLDVAGAIKVGDAVAAPVAGMIVHGDKGSGLGFYGYTGGAWVKLH